MNQHKCLFIAIALFALPLRAAEPLRAASETATSAQWDSGEYSYDGSGGIKQIGLSHYAYDRVGRLTLATVNAPGTTVTGTQEFAYDPYGNLTTVRADKNLRCIGGIDCNRRDLVIDTPTNRLKSTNAVPVDYDEQGNLRKIDSTYSYDYDPVGMMTASTVDNSSTQYIYTAGDERIAVRRGGQWQWTLRDGAGHVIRVARSADPVNGVIGTVDLTWVEDNVFTGANLLASAGSYGRRHFHLDQLGTPRLVTDDAGRAVGTHTYFPFGSEASVGVREMPRQRLQFTGHERDGETDDIHNLDYMHARLYGAALGRFFSPDPLSGSPNAPQSWNRYAYAGNNPVNATDPDGRQTCLTIQQEQPPDPLEALKSQLPSLPTKDKPFRLDPLHHPIETLINTLAIASLFTPGPEDDVVAVSAMDTARSMEATVAETATREVAETAAENASAEVTTSSVGTVMSGHGSYKAANGFINLPKDTALTIYTQPGRGISDALGNAIETGADLRPFANEMTGARSFLPGTKVPNLTLSPPTGLRIMGNPVTVSKPTTLGNLITPGMGLVHWAACLFGMPCVW